METREDPPAHVGGDSLMRFQSACEMFRLAAHPNAIEAGSVGRWAVHKVAGHGRRVGEDVLPAVGVAQIQPALKPEDSDPQAQAAGAITARKGFRHTELCGFSLSGFIRGQ